MILLKIIIDWFSQAYHNELVGKVSRLQEENTKLSKEKVGVLLILLFSCYSISNFYLFH